MINELESICQLFHSIGPPHFVTSSPRNINQNFFWTKKFIFVFVTWKRRETAS